MKKLRGRPKHPRMRRRRKDPQARSSGGLVPPRVPGLLCPGCPDPRPQRVRPLTTPGARAFTTGCPHPDPRVLALLPSGARTLTWRYPGYPSSSSQRPPGARTPSPRVPGPLRRCLRAYWVKMTLVPLFSINSSLDYKYPSPSSFRGRAKYM